MFYSIVQSYNANRFLQEINGFTTPIVSKGCIGFMVFSNALFHSFRLQCKSFTLCVPLCTSYESSSLNIFWSLAVTLSPSFRTTKYYVQTIMSFRTTVFAIAPKSVAYHVTSLLPARSAGLPASIYKSCL